MTETWEHVYQSLDITPTSLGPSTPWPNRAEAAVRLLKAQLKIMLNSVKSGNAPATLKQVTPTCCPSSGELVLAFFYSVGGRQTNHFLASIEEPLLMFGSWRSALNVFRNCWGSAILFPLRSRGQPRTVYTRGRSTFSRSLPGVPDSVNAAHSPV